ncbi:SpoIIE family protein phosphatase [Nocardioides sp.]|uniref:SpoIIE family protein phosphatase n=1 Tax=Nocardioides sp. TaxID=35761 RepID=UPI001A2061FE|nr:SpoIIE family protein phosphatase [Nocardioides sp.]MBJ7359939.1 SpoIIE family protein phosphatase [Nocardioides sp.]
MTSAASHTPGYEEADLTTCDREPIHVPGAIQPHGVLLALDPATMTAVMVSANTEELLGVAPDAGLGRPLSAFVGSEAAVEITTRVREWAPGEPLILTLPRDRDGALAGQEIDVRLHESGERLVVELESLGRPRSTLMTYQSARAAMARLSSGHSIEQLVTQLVREVRKLTEYDRVMVYRFDADWNGEVVAEDKRDDLNSFLGLHYPASDIPAQARRLYTLNWTRLIADVGYEPVHLSPVLDPGTGAPLDLTYATLRSVSPIHLEYLANMGVRASMSVSLVVDGELWGLIACHHYRGPHRPSQDARAAAEFLGQVASQQIGQREQADVREAALSAQATLARIMGRIDASGESPLRTMMEDPELLDLVGASGAALRSRGHFLTAGTVPDAETLDRLADGLLSDPYGQPVATDHAAALLPVVPDLSRTAAGVLGIASHADSWLLWLRPELPQVVDWGGDPTNKRLEETEGEGVRLSPRLSFERWREVRSGRSAPWQAWELEVATRLRTHMNALMLRRSRDQIEVAESLLRTVLPSEVPRFEGMDIAVRYVPATTYQLGGDWWDAVSLDDGRVAFVVGDTAGHGVSVVGAMTQVRAALRAYLMGGAGPAQALDRLDLLMVSLLPDQVATAVIAVWDAGSRRLEICSAGHPPAMVFAGSDVTETVATGRPLLGLGEGRAESTVLDVGPDVTVLFYTDGLVERRHADVETAVERLSALAPRVGDLGVEDFVDLVVETSGSGEDDTTVLAVRLY